MKDLKVIFASNLIRLRTDAGLTQVELAEKLNYSDKSVSKWERAEALPDVIVAKAIADLFGVTVDFLLDSHDEWTVTPPKMVISTEAITAVSILGIWAAALLLFIIFRLLDCTYWVIFIAAVPVSLITLLVLNSVWKKRRSLPVIVSLLVLSILALVCYILRQFNPWLLFAVAVPLLAIVWLSFRIRKHPKNKDEH